MRRLFLILLAGVLFLCVGCVHETPESGAPRKVTLHFHHDAGWSYTDMTISRGEVTPPAPLIEGTHSRYHLFFFLSGNTGFPILEKEIFREDLSRADFSEEVTLPPGNYEVYLWSDYADSNLQVSHFFDSADFSNIVYSEPYNGNNELRDAFRAYAVFTIRTTIENDYQEDVWVNIERPMARYEFVATDFGEFQQRELVRSRSRNAGNEARGDEAQFSESALDGYRVKVRYTGYMPTCFDNFRNKPVNSQTGMEYEARITPLSDEEARIGFDYVMVNGHESTVKVALEIYDSDGEVIATTPSFDVPTKRSQNTTVRGRFLTSSVGSGIGIDPSFKGEFNIRI